MQIIGVGIIKGYKNLPHGVMVKIRCSQIGWLNANGKMVGEIDDIWYCVIQVEYLAEYAKKHFKPETMVKFIGKMHNAPKKENEYGNIANIYIQTLELCNFGDPKKKRLREKYNKNILGDDIPDIYNGGVDNDF